MKTYWILVGSFGSGKSELALNLALEKIEIMSLSARVYSVFAPGEGHVIFDIGGDDVGSIALGQYKPRFDQVPADRLHVLFVVNPLRPTAADLPSALDTLYKIQYVSRLPVTGIVNNGNLSVETDAEHLVQGYELVKALSLQTGIPVWGTCGSAEVLRSFEEYAQAHDLDPAFIGKYQPIEIMMHRSWDKFLKEGL